MVSLAVLLFAQPLVVSGVFVKGSFHQHATQPWESCHRAADTIDACGGDCLHEQDDGGTDADVLLKAIKNAGRGHQFVGIIGNEELATQPKNHHGLVVMNVMENQMAALCTKGEKHCKHGPCEPVTPQGAGPWLATNPPVNNLHREYIEGVPGVFVQHPTTDPQREEVLAYMTSGQDNVRGMEVYNAWVDQAWDVEIPSDDAHIDAIYPWYNSNDCLAWVPELSVLPSDCSLGMAMPYWDATLRALKRPVYGLADDDGFVYTGDSDEPVYSHGNRDVQTDSPSWFRFGVAWNMVDVPSSSFTGQDVANAVDQGKFYASTGVDLTYDTSGDVITVNAAEPVIFGAVGGIGSESDSNPLSAFNLTLCMAAGEADVVTNIGCGAAATPPMASQLRIDMTAIEGSFFFVRIQAYVRSRYSITSVPNGKKWEFGLDGTLNDADFLEGRLLRATGKSRRPFVVQSMSGNTVQVVNQFSDGYGDITPDSTTVTDIVAGRDQMVAERWAWMQPVWRRRSQRGALEDPFQVDSVHV